MTAPEPGSPWQPLAQSERYRTLDVIRGISLFGVLLVNLLDGFRVSLFEYILTFHTHPGWANHLVDVLVAGVVEFKAFSLFSLMFGVGVAIQAERAAKRGININRFLARRFLVLLGIGLCHLLLIWNGDILTLYAVCGLLLVPLLRLPPKGLAIVGAAFIVLPFFVPFGFPFPHADALRAQATAAARVYGQGGFAEILAFRVAETWPFIVPLLVGSLPRTAGLMMCGVSAWRSGVLREPERHWRLLWTITLGAGLIGSTTTALQVFSRSTGQPALVPSLLLDLGSTVPLAFAYAAGLLLWLRPGRAWMLTAPFAAAGQMALTNYLAQSVIFGIIFYGYGFGLFGRIGPARGTLIGVAVYAGQMAFSLIWLRHYRFGPCEWFWRSMTYGQRQPMRRAA